MVNQAQHFCPVACLLCNIRSFTDILDLVHPRPVTLLSGCLLKRGKADSRHLQKWMWRCQANEIKNLNRYIISELLLVFEEPILVNQAQHVSLIGVHNCKGQLYLFKINTNLHRSKLLMLKDTNFAK